MALVTPDRRAGCGEELTRAFLDAGGPVTFDELVRAASSGQPGDVAGWLGHAVAEGLVQDLGVERDNARCYRLTARGRRMLSGRRPRRDAAEAA
jgi:hypothetical protein